MSAATIDLGNAPGAGCWEWLRRELAPFPGREAMTVRLVVAVSLVVIISMTLQVPEVALSAYLVFFVTKENRALTTLTGILLIVGATVAISASLFLYRYTLDFPALRVVTMAAVIFVGMYLSRVFVIGPLGFAIGFVAAMAQSIVDGEHTAEMAVRSLLWLWVIVVYPIVVTVVLNRVLLPAEPRTALFAGLTRRLDAVAGALRRIVAIGGTAGLVDAALRDLATRGNAPLHRLLGLAEKKDVDLRARHAALSAAIASTEQLVTAAAALEMRASPSITTNDHECVLALVDEIVRLRSALERRDSVHRPTGLPVIVARLPELRELQLAAVALHESLADRETAGGNAPIPVKTKKRLISADAFTNPSHVRFALKVTLAAMACYFIYTALDWSGIHTAFITCCFLALENTGATMRKAWLRLGGCLIGGLLGFLTLLYLVPRMEGIVSLVLLTAAVSALAGWVAAGSERISYAGLQIAFAFYLSVFQGFAPATGFDVIRDRIAGIILGIFVLSLVFRYFWPEQAGDRLKAMTVLVLHQLARLLTIPRAGASAESSTNEAAPLRAEMTSTLDAGVRSLEVAGFEEDEMAAPLRSRTRRLEAIFRRTQDLYLTVAILTEEAACSEWQALAASARTRDLEMREAVTARLTHLAGLIESDSTWEVTDPIVTPLPSNEAARDVPDDGRAGLLRRLLAQTESSGPG